MAGTRPRASLGRDSDPGCWCGDSTRGRQLGGSLLAPLCRQAFQALRVEAVEVQPAGWGRGCGSSCRAAVLSEGGHAGAPLPTRRELCTGCKGHLSHQHMHTHVHTQASGPTVFTGSSNTDIRIKTPTKLKTRQPRPLTRWLRGTMPRALVSPLPAPDPRLSCHPAMLSSRGPRVAQAGGTSESQCPGHPDACGGTFLGGGGKNSPSL